MILNSHDRRPIGTPAGQADGIQPRTIEVLQVRPYICERKGSDIQSFQSYGLAESLLKDGAQMHLCVRPNIFQLFHILISDIDNVQAFYNPGPNGGIEVR